MQVNTGLPNTGFDHASVVATVRHHLDYTAAQVIDLLNRRAAALNLPVASKASLTRFRELAGEWILAWIC